MGVTNKIGAATNSRKNYKKDYKKKPGGELICKKIRGDWYTREYVSNCSGESWPVM